MKPITQIKEHPPAQPGTAVLVLESEFSRPGHEFTNLAHYLSHVFNVQPEQARQIVEIVETLGRLERDHDQARHEAFAAMQKPRCNGTEHWDKEQYLYINHSAGSTCPMHGEKRNSRVRKYIGNKPEKIAEAREVMENHRQWMKKEKARKELQSKLETAKAAITAAHRLRNGDKWRKW